MLQGHDYSNGSAFWTTHSSQLHFKNGEKTGTSILRTCPTMAPLLLQGQLISNIVRLMSQKQGSAGTQVPTTVCTQPPTSDALNYHYTHGTP